MAFDADAGDNATVSWVQVKYAYPGSIAGYRSRAYGTTRS